MQKILLGVCGALLCAAVSVGVSAASTDNARDLEIDFFDIGQGDAIFIQTPAHQTILIDGGRDGLAAEKIATELPFGQRTIDLVIVTHPDLDHVGGIPAVLRRYRVGMLFMIDATRSLPVYQELIRLAEEQHIPIRHVTAGDMVRFSSDVTMDILAPEKGATATGDLNNSSIVGKLTYNTRSFLFTGDAEFESEDRMIGTHAPLAVDILKIGHHGSRYSSSERFLRAVHARAGVISAGARNTYGHPHPDVLRRMADQHMNAYRTDTQGTVEMTSDGEFITITTEK